MEHSIVTYNARTALLAALLVVALLAAPAAGKSPKKRPKRKQAKYAEITFYVNATIGFNSFFVVPPLAGRPTQPVPPTVTLFGGVNVIDTFIRSGVEPDSQLLGSAKGVLVLDNNDKATGPGLELVATAIFNDASGFGAGTTISYQGYSQDHLPVREVSISGGTGRFRLARGWAEISTAKGGGFSSSVLFVSHVFYYDLEQGEGEGKVETGRETDWTSMDFRSKASALSYAP